MKDLFESFKTASEFTILGGMATAVLAYAIIWIHPLKDATGRYLADSKRYLFGPDGVFGKEFDSRARVTLVALFVLGGLYYLGSVTNAAGYWLMEPTHDIELTRYYWTLPQKVPTTCDHVKQEAERDKSFREKSIDQGTLLFRPVIRREETPCEKLTHQRTLQDEADWRTNARESAAESLDDIVKHIRLSRGAAVCALGLVVLTTLKILAAVYSLLRDKLSVYKIFIDEKATETPPARKTTKEYLKAYAVTLVLSFAIYGICLKGYINTEREFHGLAFYGAQAAMPLKTCPPKTCPPQAPEACQ